MADTDFGFKIGLEGEKEFKKAIADINQSFKVLGSEMNLATSAFDKNDKSVESLAARNRVLNKEIEAQKQKVSTLEQALQNAADSFGENDKRTQSWQIQLNNAKAALNGMEKELEDNKKAAHDMTDALENLGSIAGGIGAAIGGAVAAIGAAVVVAGKELITLGDSYNKAVNTIGAATGATGAELEALGETAKNVYTHNFGESLEDVAQGLADVQKTTGLVGVELEKATESGFALRDTFGYELQESARTAGALMKNFGLSAEEAYNIIAVGAQNGADQNGDLLDILNEYSAQYAALGLSADEFLQGLISGADAGVFSIDKVGDAVKEFNIRAKDGSDSTAEAFIALGMNAEEMTARFANGGESARSAFFEVVGALNAMEDPMAKNTAAVNLFGTMYEDLEANILPVLASMENGTMEMYDALSQINEIRYDDLDSALEGTKRSIEGVFLPTVSEVSGAITDIFSTLSNEINNANGDFGRISAAIGHAVGEIAAVVTEQLPMFLQLGADIVGSLGNAILENLPMLLEATMDLVMTILNGIISALPQITEGAVQLILALVDGVVANLPTLVEAAMQMITALVSGIVEALPQLIPAAVEAITTIVQGLIDNLPMLLDAALQLILGLAQGLLDALPQLIEALPGIIDGIVDFLITGIPQIIDAGIQLLTSLVDALPEIIQAIVKVLPQIIDGIATALLEGLPLIVEAGVELFTALVEDLPEIINTIVDALPEIIGAIVDALLSCLPQIIDAGVQLFIALVENLPEINRQLRDAALNIVAGILKAFKDSIPKIVEMGKNLVLGLWEGIQSLASWLWDKVNEWISSIWDGICDFFGIHSPSKEMGWIGEMLVEGLAGSIDKNGRDAVKSAERLADGISSVMQGMTADIGAAIPSHIDMNTTLSGVSDIGRSSGGQAFNVTIPLTMDGTTLARMLAEIQWTQNAAYVRNLGTA